MDQTIKIGIQWCVQHHTWMGEIRYNGYITYLFDLDLKSLLVRINEIIP